MGAESFCTQKLETQMHLHRKAFAKYFVLQSLHPVLPCTTKLAQSTPQYYFVLQSLHNLLPSTTLYDKFCTQYFPVLLCTLHRRLHPLYTEERKVSCSGFLPKTTPLNIHAAIAMRFAAPRTHPCSHYNAICIRVLQNTKGEPITPETIQTAPASHTRYLSSPAAATLHGKTQGFVEFRAPASSPQQSPCNSQAASTMCFAATRAHPCSHYNAICIPVLQNTKGEPITPGTIQTAPAAHTR